jgi:acyl-CoA dehydrogenase family protein 9
MASGSHGSFLRGLFIGDISMERLPSIPALSNERGEILSMILDSVRKFLASHHEQFREFDRKGAQPDEYVTALAELGLFGLIIPEEHGGLGCSAREYARVLEEISRQDASTSLTVGAHSSIGMKGILLFGSVEQKERYLPKLASGEYRAAFCLTEAGSGSDAASITTRAHRQDDGSWVLTGEKIWITNGSFAEIFTVFAKSGDAEGDITAFIVERAFPGVSSGPKEDKMGIRASATCSVRFDGVRIPAENVLGAPGGGFKIAMAILNNGRTGLGGGCVGAMKRCIEMATAHAVQRKQFGRPIASFALIQEKLAHMTALCYATEAVVDRVAFLIDSNEEDFSLEAASSKVFGTESLWRVADEALQIAGGNGFMREYPFERIVRDSRINRIFEGTNEILRLYVGLTGAKEAGSYLERVGQGVGSLFSEPSAAMSVVTDYASKRLVEYIPGMAHGGQFEEGELAPHFRILAKYSAAFAHGVDSSVRHHRRGIAEQQLVVKRLAECAIDLFVGWCVLSRVDNELRTKSPNAHHGVAVATVLINEIKRRVNQNIRRLSRNEDIQVAGIGAAVVEKGGYLWE